MSLETEMNLHDSFDRMAATALKMKAEHDTMVEFLRRMTMEVRHVQRFFPETPVHPFVVSLTEKAESILGKIEGTA